MEVRNALEKTIHKIEHREEYGIVEADWNCSASKQDLKQALSLGLIVNEQMRCSYRLDNLNNLSAQRTKWVAWLMENWLPRASRAGIRYIAFLVRHHSFVEAAGAAHFLDSIGSLIEVRLFTDREIALNWLKTKPMGGL